MILDWVVSCASDDDDGMLREAEPAGNMGQCV